MKLTFLLVLLFAHAAFSQSQSTAGGTLEGGGPALNREQKLLLLSNLERQLVSQMKQSWKNCLGMDVPKMENLSEAANMIMIAEVFKKVKFTEAPDCEDALKGNFYFSEAAQCLSGNGSNLARFTEDDYVEIYLEEELKKRDSAGDHNKNALALIEFYRKLNRPFFDDTENLRRKQAEQLERKQKKQKKKNKK